jgi:hypothetical protein
MQQTNHRSKLPAQSPSVTVAMEVASREGTDPTELTPPLNTVVDPDALDALFAGVPSRLDRGSVRFDYLGYEVEVSSDGRVRVDD